MIPDMDLRLFLRGGIAMILLFGSVVPSAQQSFREDKPKRGKAMTFKIESPAFQDDGMIPAKYTCDGLNVSPPLKWTSSPPGTKSLALICDDPDAPTRTWVHWVMFNLPPDVNELQENVPPVKILKNGAMQGMNDSGRTGYGSPCPPSGTHRYYFKLYALDTMLALASGTTKDQLLKAMESHILAEDEIMGKYQRQ